MYYASKLENIKYLQKKNIYIEARLFTLDKPCR